jgi:catechol 2,3-dioxygenase-like lactoylglutathione lyase family enzyme
LSNQLPITKIDQVCVVVRNLDKAMAEYHDRLGIGPWRYFTFAKPPLRELTFRGEPANYSMRVAFAQYGQLQFELIEPVAGPTIYHEFLAEHGEGIHHFGSIVPSLDAAIAEAEAAGYRVIQSGRGTGLGGDGGFAYLSTADALGAVFELIEIPKERRSPEGVYPST